LLPLPQVPLLQPLPISTAAMATIGPVKRAVSSAKKEVPVVTLTPHLAIVPPVLQVIMPPSLEWLPVYLATKGSTKMKRERLAANSAYPVPTLTVPAMLMLASPALTSM